jgi:hypothetical protein
MKHRSFLLKLLAGIFFFQACLFSTAFVACWMNGGLKSCPDIGKRYDATFTVMIATTLALLTNNKGENDA